MPRIRLLKRERRAGLVPRPHGVQQLRLLPVQDSMRQVKDHIVRTVQAGDLIVRTGRQTVSTRGQTVLTGLTITGEGQTVRGTAISLIGETTIDLTGETIIDLTEEMSIGLRDDMMDVVTDGMSVETGVTVLVEDHLTEEDEEAASHPIALAAEVTPPDPAEAVLNLLSVGDRDCW